MSSSFAALGVSARVVDALAAGGIERPFAIQRLVIADVLAGRDVLAGSPTGSGKTLAFAVPLVDSIECGGPRPAARGRGFNPSRPETVVGRGLCG